MRSGGVPKSSQRHDQNDLAGELSKSIKYLISALQGATEWVDRDNQVRLMVIRELGKTLFDAACDGPLREIVDLDSVVPPHHLLQLQLQRSELRTLAAMRINLANIPGDDLELESPIEFRDDALTSQSTTSDATVRHAGLAQKINDMLRDLDEGTGPARADLDFAAEQVVNYLWQNLSKMHADQLPSRLAALRAEIAPLPEPPWSGSPEDCLKAAWVGEYLLLQLDQSLDPAKKWPGWLTIAEAAAISGINKGVISRACDKETIKTNGLRGNHRRLSPVSLTVFIQDRDRIDSNNAASSQQAVLDEKGTWKCSKCGEQWPDGPRASDVCPSCNAKASLSPPSKRNRATLRNR